MNRKYLLFFLLLISISGSALPPAIDSLNRLLQEEKRDNEKAILLRKLSAEYNVFRPDTALILAQRSLIISRRIHFVSGEADALNVMAIAYRTMGNYPKALNYFLEQLKIVESGDDLQELAVIKMNISNVYQHEGDHAKALIYALMSNKLIEENDLDYYRYYSYLNLADIYDKLNEIPQALSYANKAYNIGLKKNSQELIGASLNNLGNVYNSANSLDTALEKYRQAIPLLQLSNNYDFLCESLIGISDALFKKGLTDSAIYYGKQSLAIAQRAHFNRSVLNASSALNNYYNKLGNLDSAYRFQSLLLTIKDSIYSQERVKQIQSITIEENLRQKELAELKKLEQEEREKRLQLLFVGLLIPLSFLVSILLAKRKIKPRIVEFSGIVSLLLFFEYITLLIHPWVMEVTHHTPIYEIIIFVVIAAIITPSHHRIEHWMITKLTFHHGKKYHHPEPKEQEHLQMKEQPAKDATK